MIGSRVRDARQARQLSRAELAARLGIPPGRLVLYELGARRVSAEMLFQLATVLNVRLANFF